MSETIDQPVGLDRCRRTLHTLFALELIELGKFVWRRRNDHEWEVGRWPGLELTLLAQPEWQSQRAPFAICPFPGSDGSVPFILVIAFQSHTVPDSTSGDTSVSVTSVPTIELQRDVRIYAHQIFDAALWLQLPHLEKRYMRPKDQEVERPLEKDTSANEHHWPKLPCMKSLMDKQYPFTAPASAIHIRALSTHP